MANEKIIAQDVFEQSIKDILTLLVNNTYNFTEYTDEEVGNLIDLDPTQIAELTAVISDSVVAKNKVFSSSHTTELIQKSVIESNEYADSLVANLSNIKLDIVDTLPDASTVNKSTIYILKDSTGGTNNTLNVWSDATSAFVEVGKLNVNMDSYYTKSDVDTLLADKADDNTVVHQDDVVSDMTTTSGTTVLSTSGLKTELDKKANDDEVLKTTDIATTIGSASTNSQVSSAKAVYDNAIKDKNLKTYTTLEQLGLADGCSVEDIYLKLPDNSYFECGVFAIQAQSGLYKILNVPQDTGLLTIRKYNSYRFSLEYKVSASGSVTSNELYIGQLKGSDGSGLTWRKVCATKVKDSSGTVTLPDDVTGTIFYKVINGICYVSIQGLADGLTGDQVPAFTGLPKADMYVNVGIESFGIRVGSIYSDDGVTFHVHKIETYSGYGSFSYPVAES